MLHERGQSAAQEALEDSHAPYMAIVRTQQLSPWGFAGWGRICTSLSILGAQSRQAS